MCDMISGLFIGSNDGRPPQAYKENIVSLSGPNVHWLENGQSRCGGPRPGVRAEMVLDRNYSMVNISTKRYEGGVNILWP